MLLRKAEYQIEVEMSKVWWEDLLHKKYPHLLNA